MEQIKICNFYYIKFEWPITTTISFPQMNGTNYNQSIGKSIQFDHSVAIRWCSKNLWT